MNTLQVIKVENKRVARIAEANKQQETAKQPITYAKAWVGFNNTTAVAGKCWHLVIEFFHAGPVNRYSPAEQYTESFEWLDQAFTAIGNAIRVRGLHECKIEVASQGQPSVSQDEIWPSNW